MNSIHKPLFCSHLYLVLRNGHIAELLALDAESAKRPLPRALRRASRRVFLWPVEAADLRDQKMPCEYPNLSSSLTAIPVVLFDALCATIARVLWTCCATRLVKKFLTAEFTGSFIGNTGFLTKSLFSRAKPSRAARSAVPKLNSN